MTAFSHPQSVTNLLKNAPPKLATVLAKPWHYRRNGRYYLRLRPRSQALDTFTVSLRTTDRTLAMEIAKNILDALAVFHLDRPDATWDELKAQLLVIAEDCLRMAHGEESHLVYSHRYVELYSALKNASATQSLSLDHHRALGVAQEILTAAHSRIDGRSANLVEIIDRLNKDGIPDSLEGVSESLSVGATKPPVSWTQLAHQYMSEHSVNLKEQSRASAMTNHKVIGEAFDAIGVTDLGKHTRENLIALRDKLLETRKPSTVNNLVQKLTTVLTWAVNNDKLAKAYTAKLKINKGADSEREAFTRPQVTALMEYANGLAGSSWERWAISLAVITGARVGEIAYLTKDDIKSVDGIVCIDINEDGTGKSVKNKYSARLVPLVDGCLGFDLAMFQKAAEAGALPSAHSVGPGKASKVLNLMIKKVLGSDLDEDKQTLHSLRHHLVSSMKAEGVELQFAQAVTGHASRTITYDGYGSSVPLRKMHDAINIALGGASK